MKNQNLSVTWTLVLLAAAFLLAGCSDSSSSYYFVGVRGTVTNANGEAVVGAIVYLVPTSAIDTRPIYSADVIDGSAEDRDEPLEDAVKAGGAGFQQAMTAANGSYSIGRVTDGKYYLYVEPAAGDTDHLPGGDLCRVARKSDDLKGRRMDIVLSSTPSLAATYVGSTSCLGCHPDTAGEKATAHRLGFSVPGQLGGLQNDVNFPGYFDGVDQFLPGAVFTDGTVLGLGDYDPNRGFDKFLCYPGLTPPQITLVYANVYLWQDMADGLYKITIVNALNGGDPPLTLTVRLTYGAAVYKQRFLIEYPGLNGLYPFVQYQAFPFEVSTGDDSRYDRTRAVFRDYHLDWHWSPGPNTTFGDGDDVLVPPPVSKTISSNCAACHFTGFTVQQDMGTMEWLADAVDDVGGAYDYDGDGNLDEINVGCESCHGPGSEHVMDGEGRHIVSLEYLSPSRANQICGRCHDRTAGAGLIGGDSPVNMNNEMMPPGESRETFLADYVTRKGPDVASHFWGDELHSKSHHQQWPDIMKSTHYRNDRQLVVCGDCHDPHAYRTQQGLKEYPHNLLDDPADPNSLLCQRCHTVDVSQHMLEETGSAMNGNQASCISCHMARTAKTGAGLYGLLLDTPTGAASDADIVYWMNDVSSHLFDVPSKNYETVAGVQPGKAMPIPYTNSCSAPCHDASNLQYK